MAFGTEPTVTPAAIGRIVIRLKSEPSPNEGEPDVKSARFQVDVLDADGRLIVTREGDLVPHISTADRDALIDFVNRMRAKAIEEILP